MVRVVQKNNLQNYSATGDANLVIKAQILPFEDTILLLKLPDNQLVIESAVVTESGGELLLKFNDPVKLTDTTTTGIKVFLNHVETTDITGFSYSDTDSLEVKINLATSIYAGKLVNISIEDSELYSTRSSRLNNITNISVKNNSILVEDEYMALSVSTGLIAQDDQSANIDFYVFSTSTYTLELESNWSTVSKTNGIEYDTIQVHFDDNLTTVDRLDTIFIYSENGLEERIILSQMAASSATALQERPGDKLNKLTVFPSPTSDFLNLSIPEQYPLPAKLSLVSMSGQKLETINIHDYLVSINVKDLPPGFYILQLRSGGLQLEERFIVK
jgi:hypothetical protein